MSNLFTVDLEDWFSPRHLKGFSQLNWDKCEVRIEKPTLQILDLLEKYSVKAVFFVLGYIANKRPDLIKLIAEKGHEIASHGYSHFQVHKQNKSEFENDIYKSLEIMSKLGFDKIRAYRAPVFSLNNNTEWALDILKKYKFEISSSFYPTNLHNEYGVKNMNPEIHYHYNGLLEIPMNSVNIFNNLIPCSGGGYFRIYPYKLFSYLAKQSMKNTNHYVFYIHPWELDVMQPKIPSGFLNNFRHYYNLSNTYSKLEILLSEFKFDSLDDFLKKQKI